MSKGEIRGKWALVTGASSGLGVDFAEQLAARGAHVVLVARREDRLREVAERIEAGHGVKTEVIAMDLGADGAAEALHGAVQSRGLQVDLLVNNAGFGQYGFDLEIPWERARTMLQLDMVTLAHLTRLFGRDMAERGHGRILQVSSIGAYQATPTYAAYSAAKAFVLHYSEALDFELRPTGVSVTTVSPGVTATEFLERSGQKPTRYQRLFMMKSADVARIGLDAALKGRRSIIPGLLNAALAFSLRFMPRSLQHFVAFLTMKQPGERRPKALTTG